MRHLSQRHNCSYVEVVAKKEQRPVFFVCYVGSSIFKDRPAAILTFPDSALTIRRVTNMLEGRAWIGGLSWLAEREQCNQCTVQ